MQTCVGVVLDYMYSTVHRVRVVNDCTNTDFTLKKKKKKNPSLPEGSWEGGGAGHLRGGPMAAGHRRLKYTCVTGGVCAGRLPEAAAPLHHGVPGHGGQDSLPRRGIRL